jgi:uncharacterized membrane protein YqjE
MSARLALLVVVLTLFGALTTLALMDVGCWRIIQPQFQSWGAGQVLADLVIVAALSCVWMLNDARGRGPTAWPFVALTLVAGSFGPLLYLVLRESRSAAR